MSPCINISFLCDPPPLLESAMTIEGKGTSTILKAYGYAKYLEQFWLPIQRRKHPAKKLEFRYFDAINSDDTTNDHAQQDDIVLQISTDAQHEDEESNKLSKDETFWIKLLIKEIKKVVVEDLGNMNAIELWNRIPTSVDSDGRSQQDLLNMEHELGVKVIFGIPFIKNNDNARHHVLLVGSKSKLSKKCFVIRNFLKHYHWRLTGKE